MSRENKNNKDKKKFEHGSYNSKFDINKLIMLDETWYSSEKPHHFQQLAKIIRPPGAKSLKILDLTAHVGFFSLRWATDYPQDQIVSIEMNKANYAALVYNIKALGVKNVSAINGDSTQVVKTLDYNPDIIYIDPPFGGPDYKLQKSLVLPFGKPDILDWIPYLKKLFPNAKVWVKLPRNYALPKGTAYWNIWSSNQAKPVPDFILLSF